MRNTHENIIHMKLFENEIQMKTESENFEFNKMKSHKIKQTRMESNNIQIISYKIIFIHIVS